jgi:hypothetical protein
MDVLKAKSVLDYTCDRIYCEAELCGKPENGIHQGITKLTQLLENPQYDICNDLDENNNNILHLISVCGFYEFYNEIKKHKDFNKIANAHNKDNMTPYDVAKLKLKIFKGVIGAVQGDIYSMVIGYVTSPYYMTSYDRLIAAMKIDGLRSNSSLKKNLVHLLERSSDNPLIKTLQQMIDTFEGTDEQLWTLIMKTASNSKMLRACTAEGESDQPISTSSECVVL